MKLPALGAKVHFVMDGAHLDANVMHIEWGLVNGIEYHVRTVDLMFFDADGTTNVVVGVAYRDPRDAKDRTWHWPEGGES